MSDPKSNYGQPVEEPAADDDVVGRANDSLADAEAAQRDAVADSRRDAADSRRDAVADSRRDAAAEPIADPAEAARTAEAPPVQPVGTSRADEPLRDDRPGATDAAAPAPAPVYSDAPASDDDEDGRYAVYEASSANRPAEPETVVVTSVDDRDRYDRDRDDTAVAAPVPAPVVTPSEPVGPQPIFVQAPEAPRPRGNRGAAGAIGLLAAVCFAVLYLVAGLAFAAIAGFVTGENFLETLLGALGTAGLWVPVVVFFIAFWLLGAIINRGRWGVWVVFGILVGIASYGGHILGALIQEPFWTLTAREGAELAESQLLAPLAIAAFVIGRELTIWFGAWVAARGRRVTELNVEARREYERTLEAGPQLSRM